MSPRVIHRIFRVYDVVLQAARVDPAMASKLYPSQSEHRGGTEADRLLRIFLRETIKESLTLLS